ncbi:MAG: hypothetical protein O7I42_20430 [Alphaproteobacteria bacterium]|nr:hypothetical protein [Alphaproteobacteria bacterium]
MLIFSGNGDETIEQIKTAKRLSPRDPSLPAFYSIWAEAALTKSITHRLRCQSTNCIK